MKTMYELIEADTAKSLKEEVDKYLDLGYKLEGSISVSGYVDRDGTPHRTYSQPMTVKIKKRKQEELTEDEIVWNINKIVKMDYGHLFSQEKNAYLLEDGSVLTLDCLKRMVRSQVVLALMENIK